ncbi:hypothetical protein GCM10010245_57990 [Streptomyces spectabilis]|nr:hypothetical protein GCM10010245_57990 [Streptomyces spectabilis]
MGTAHGERVGDQEQAKAGQDRPRKVQAPGGEITGFWQVPQAEEHGRHSDGHIDQEDRTPSEAEDIGAGEHPAQDRSGDAAQRHDGAVEAERLGAGTFVEADVQGGQDLRNHDRRGATLDDASRDQQGGRTCQTTDQRRRGEDAGPQEKEPLAAIEIAQLATGDQPEGEGQRVGGVDPLHRGARGAGVVLNGGKRRVDDRTVEGIHQLRDQDDNQHDGTTTGGTGAGGGGAGGEGLGVKGHNAVPVLADRKGKVGRPGMPIPLTARQENSGTATPRPKGNRC